MQIMKTFLVFASKNFFFKSLPTENFTRMPLAHLFEVCVPADL